MTAGRTYCFFVVTTNRRNKCNRNQITMSIDRSGLAAKVEALPLQMIVDHFNPGVLRHARGHAGRILPGKLARFVPKASKAGSGPHIQRNTHSSKTGEGVGR